MGGRFRSGTAIADRVKVGNTYLNERQFIKKEDLDVTYISGTAATAGYLAAGATAVPTYRFTGGAGKEDQVSFRFVAPSSLKRKTMPRLRVLWTRMSGTSATHGDVAWGAEYWTTSILTSGTEVTGKTYNISGGLAQAGFTTTTTAYTQSTGLVSGVVNETVLDISAADVAANDLVRVQLCRFGSYAGDTFAEDVGLIGVLIEYVDG